MVLLRRHTRDWAFAEHDVGTHVYWCWSRRWEGRVNGLVPRPVLLSRAAAPTS